MPLDAERLEELVYQLIHADLSQWEQLCALATDDVDARQLARELALAFLESPPDVPVGDELAGREFGNFHFIRALGAGGFGEVWLARDLELGRWVAIKFLHSRDEDHRQQLVQEAQASAGITNDNVVTVYHVVDFADLNKSAIVMELCWDPTHSLEPPSDDAIGMPLSRVPRPKKTNYRQIAARMRKIAEAVGIMKRMKERVDDISKGLLHVECDKVSRARTDRLVAMTGQFAALGIASGVRTQELWTSFLGAMDLDQATCVSDAQATLTGQSAMHKLDTLPTPNNFALPSPASQASGAQAVPAPAAAQPAAGGPTWAGAAGPV